MNLTSLIDIKERIATGEPLMLEQRNFVLQCINDAAALDQRARDPNDYPRDHKPGSHWATDKGWEIMNLIRPGAIPSALRDIMAGMIAGALVQARRLGTREGDAPGPKIHDPTIAHLIETTRPKEKK